MCTNGFIQFSLYTVPILCVVPISLSLFLSLLFWLISFQLPPQLSATTSEPPMPGTRETGRCWVEVVLSFCSRLGGPYWFSTGFCLAIPSLCEEHFWPELRAGPCRLALSAVAKVVTRATAGHSWSGKFMQTVTDCHRLSQCYPCCEALEQEKSRPELQAQPNLVGTPPDAGPNTCNRSVAAPGTSEESHRSGKGV